jgi:N-acylneuraminate cytidylyltransferase
VFIRPAHVSNEGTFWEPRLLQVLETLENGEGILPDIIVALQGAFPLIQSEDIDAAIALLEGSDAQTAFAGVPFHSSLWEEQFQGKLVAINCSGEKTELRPRSNAQFREAGSVYAMRTHLFREMKQRFFGNTLVHPISDECAWRVDNDFDMKVAEGLLRCRLGQEQRDSLPERVDALVLDFDGVFTDNRVLVSSEQQESVMCHRGDGYGIALLRERGVPMLVLSSEKNSVVAARCAKLKLECIQGEESKIEILREWLNSHGHEPANTIYVGNDLNDLECLEYVGCGVTVDDAHPEVKRVSQLHLTRSGGDGAIRELVDLLLEGMNERLK